MDGNMLLHFKAALVSNTDMTDTRNRARKNLWHPGYVMVIYIVYNNLLYFLYKISKLAILYLCFL